jgi:hypothetical protein
MVVGCKLLKANGTSLNGKYCYDLTGTWNVVPGNGAYVAVTGGLTTAGIPSKDDILVYLECEEPTGAVASHDDVQCFRHVRVIPACPERLTRELRGEIACYAPRLTAEQRVMLAQESTPELRGQVALDAPDLTPEQRVRLARESTPEWRGTVALYTPGLSAEQRAALALESTPEWRGKVACYAPRLTAEQRFELARESTPEWRGRVSALRET